MDIVLLLITSAAKRELRRLLSRFAGLVLVQQEVSTEVIEQKEQELVFESCGFCVHSTN